MKVIVAAPSDCSTHSHKYGGPNGTVFETDSVSMVSMPIDSLINFYAHPLLEFSDAKYGMKAVIFQRSEIPILIDWAEENCTLPVLIEPVSTYSGYANYASYNIFFCDGYDKAQAWTAFRSTPLTPSTKVRFKVGVDLASYAEMKKWCDENVDAKWDSVMKSSEAAVFEFTAEADATKFKLVWGEVLLTS